MTESQANGMVVGLGHVGLCCADALLRSNIDIIACDFKPVHERTLARAYEMSDVGTSKAAALTEYARRMGREHLLVAVHGRFEESIGGGDLRAVRRTFLCADRPSAVRRCWEVLSAVGDPQGLVTTVNVGMNAAQVRTFRLDGCGPCPFCTTSAQYFAASHADLAISCEDAGSIPEGGDRYSIPYGMHESYCAAGIALSGMVAPGWDATLSLTEPGHLMISAIPRDPDCPVCGEGTMRWPEASATVEADAPLHEACARAAADSGLTEELTVRFLRPISRGTHCACGRRDAPRMMRVECGVCGGRIAPLRGCGFTMALEELRAGGATARSLNLPPRDLILLQDGTGQQVTLLTTEGGSFESITS